MRKRFILSVSQFHKFAEIAVRALVERDKKSSLEKKIKCCRKRKEYFLWRLLNSVEVHATLLKGVCYSYFGNGVRPGAQTHYHMIQVVLASQNH